MRKIFTWRLGTVFDRLLAMVLGGLCSAIAVGICLEADGAFLLVFVLPLAWIYPRLLAISKSWSLFIFSLASFPANILAYVFCDISAEESTWGLLHLSHEWAVCISLMLYGVLRGTWMAIGKPGKNPQADPPEG